MSSKPDIQEKKRCILLATDFSFSAQRAFAIEPAKDEGRTGNRKPTLREDQRTDIIENILDGRKTGAQMARLYNVSEATISRVMAAHRQVLARD